MIYFKILGIKYLENVWLFFLTEISFVTNFWILHGFLWDRHLKNVVLTEYLWSVSVAEKIAEIERLISIISNKQNMFYGSLL